MKVRPLVMDAVAKAKIKEVTDLAHARRISVKDLFEMSHDRLPPPGDDPARVCLIDFGYRCVYTVEQQPEHGWCRHLSVSVTGDGVAPNPAAVQLLMAEFGFMGDFKDMLYVGKEVIDKHKVAINVIQKV